MTDDRKRPSFADYHPSDVVSRKDAALLLGVSGRTLADWATDGKGPLFVALGRRVVYQVSDLLAYLSDRKRQTA